ncbi:MAG: TonB-dependent receptor plug domain-containing protein [Flavobacteriales bacterium]
MKKIILLFPLFFLNFVFSQEITEELEAVSFSSKKTHQTSLQIPEQTHIITLEEIEKQTPQTTADLLADQPGIRVQKSQMGGGSPVIRGMEANRILLVIDGVRMNNAIYRSGHLQNTISLDANTLERSEIIYGPSSVIYGSDALGGVVHFYTKMPKTNQKDLVKIELMERYSSANNEFTSNANIALSGEKIASFTSFTYSDFGDLRMGSNAWHNFDQWGKTYLYSDNTEDYYNPDPVINNHPNIQKNTGYTQADFLQKLVYEINANHQLIGNFQYSKSSDIPRYDNLSETQGNGLKWAEWYYGPQERLMTSLQYRYRNKSKFIREAIVTGAYQNVKESRIQRRFNRLERAYRHEKVNVYSLNADLNSQLNKKLELSYGAEFTHNDVSSNAYGRELILDPNNNITGYNTTVILSRYPDGGSSYTTLAGYAQLVYSISSKHSLDLGSRYTKTMLSAKWVDETYIKLPQNEIDLNNGAFTGSIGYSFTPTKHDKISMVLSSGFRSPNIDDIGKVREQNGEALVPNLTLKPEYAYNAEFNFQKRLWNRFTLGGNIYYTLLDNYIIRDLYVLPGTNGTLEVDGESFPTAANVNKNQAYIWGTTGYFDWKMNRHFKINSDLTFTKGKTKDTRKPMPSIPPLFGQTSLQYSFQDWDFVFNSQYNARKYGDEYGGGVDSPELAVSKEYGIPAWVTFNLMGNYKINENISVQVNLDNIFDIHYREFASGISAPGRNFRFTFRARL